MPEYSFKVDIPIDVDRFITEGRMDFYAQKIGELLCELLLKDVQTQATKDLEEFKVEVKSG